MCVHVCMCLCVHVRVSVYVHVYVGVCVYVHVSTCVCMSVFTRSLGIRCRVYWLDGKVVKRLVWKVEVVADVSILFFCTLAGSMVVDSIVESMSGHSDILFVFAF